MQTLPVLGGTVPGKQEMSLPQIIIIGTGLGARPSQTWLGLRGKLMNLDKAVLRFAGVVVLVSAVLSITVHPWWIGLTIFAGVNMLQASFTGFCPAAMIFKKLGARPGNAFR